MTNPYIIFDIPSILALKKQYEDNIEYIKAELPPVNWNSISDTVDYFKYEHNITLHGIKIAYLKSLLDTLDKQPEYYCRSIKSVCEAIEVLSGLIELFAIQSIKRNYIDCILRHQVDGKVMLRDVDGKWMFPNKQPLPYATEIKECIISSSGI